MKYKVIGWTNSDNYDIPSSRKEIGFAERNAIIDEIRKHKYLFTGWHHQESYEYCVPILNDGKKREFSQRGWGSLMAEAYEEMGDFDYANYTFENSIKKEYLSFPKKEYDINKFVSKSFNQDSFKIEISKELFDIAKSQNPFYLEDLEQLRYIDINDKIILVCNNDSLFYVVEEVSKNKKEINFKEHELINTKYKISIKYKTDYKKIMPKIGYLIPRYQINNEVTNNLIFLDEFMMIDLFEVYGVDVVLDGFDNTIKVNNLLKSTLSTYIQYKFDLYIVLDILNFMDDINYFKEIAFKLLEETDIVLISFVKKHNNYKADIIKQLKDTSNNFNDLIKKLENI